MTQECIAELGDCQICKCSCKDCDFDNNYLNNFFDDDEAVEIFVCKKCLKELQLIRNKNFIKQNAITNGIDISTELTTDETMLLYDLNILQIDKCNVVENFYNKRSLIVTITYKSVKDNYFVRKINGIIIVMINKND